MSAIPDNVATVTSIGNGYFNVGGKTVNISQMMQMVNWTRIDSLDGLSAAKATLMQQISNQIMALKELYMWAETAKSTKNAAHTDDGTTFSLPGYDDKKTFKGWCDQFGIDEISIGGPAASAGSGAGAAVLSALSVGDMDTDEWKQQWDTNAQSVNDAIDSLKTASEKLYTEAKDINDTRQDKISEMKMYMDQYHQNNSKLLQ